MDNIVGYLRKAVRLDENSQRRYFRLSWIVKIAKRSIFDPETANAQDGQHSRQESIAR